MLQLYRKKRRTKHGRSSNSTSRTTKLLAKNVSSHNRTRKTHNTPKRHNTLQLHHTNQRKTAHNTLYNKLQQNRRIQTKSIYNTNIKTTP